MCSFEVWCLEDFSNPQISVTTTSTYFYDIFISPGECLIASPYSQAQETPTSIITSILAIL